VKSWFFGGLDTHIENGIVHSISMANIRIYTFINVWRV